MNNNLRLVINNVNNKNIDEKYFFEKNELKIIKPSMISAINRLRMSDAGRLSGERMMRKVSVPSSTSIISVLSALFPIASHRVIKVFD